MQCSNNLKQIALGLHNYESAYRTFPPGFISRTTGPWPGGGNDPVPEVGPGWSVFAMVLPQIEQPGLFESINFSRPITDAANQAARSTIVKEYQCPSDVWRGPVTVWPTTIGINDLASASYTCSLGGGNPANAPAYSAMYEEQPFNGMFHRNRAIRHADILDGTSNTIGMGERASMFAPNGWAGVIPGGQTVFSPRDRDSARTIGGSHDTTSDYDGHGTRANRWSERTDRQPRRLWSPHTGGCLFMMMDGSIQTLSTNVDMTIYRAMASRNDRTPITMP